MLTEFLLVSHRARFTVHLRNGEIEAWESGFPLELYGLAGFVDGRRAVANAGGDEAFDFVVLGSSKGNEEEQEGEGKEVDGTARVEG